MDKRSGALILAGGLGTRLRSVSGDLPKSMVHVEGRPFLYWLIKHLGRHGYRHFYFSTGYKAQPIVDFPWAKAFPQFYFDFVYEESPLGTGGAVRNAFEKFADLESCWMINGDTLVEFPPSPQNSSKSLVTYTALKPENIFDAKPNLVVEGAQVVGIDDQKGTYFDGGHIFVTRGAVAIQAPANPCGFSELIAPLLQKGEVSYNVVSGTCYDIGTPARLERFRQFCSQFSE